MANEVFANGRELACKAGSGKTIAAFPDTCFTPPENPATPPGVPVPYPNTGKASDTTKGSKKVMISGKEIMLKDSSYFKTSMGDEAGSAAKKGVITSKNKGKVYFQAWSMDVKFEGENVDRHLDMTTNNHASMAGDTPPWPFADSMAIDAAGNTEDPCAKEKKQVEDNCSQPIKMEDICPKGYTSKQKLAASFQKDPCLRALRCRLVPYNKGKEMCCPDQTPDHLIEASAFAGGRKIKKYSNWTYNPREAPCMCVSGHAANVSTHGVLSTKRKALVMLFRKKHKTKIMSIGQAAKIGAATASHTFKGCSKKCIEAQLLDYHKDKDQIIKPPAYGSSFSTNVKGKRGMAAAAQKLAEKLFALI